MSDAARITDAQLEAYLDDQLSEEHLELFQRRLATDTAAQQDLAHRVAADNALRDQFKPPARSVAEIERWLPVDLAVVARGRPWRRPRLVLAGLAIAVSVAWLFVFSQWRENPKLQPFFEPRALVQIYNETVREGFRPYYVCDDEGRFAETFAKRQKVPLRLAQLPPSRSMAGLSYLGGLSRDTTAMLCYVDQQPVMVFVDRREFKRSAILTVPQESPLFIHESALGDLMLYEVTPFPQPKMMEFLQVVRGGGS